MKKLISQAVAVLLVNGAVMTAFAGEQGTPQMLKSGFYGGIGGSLNSIDESFNSTLRTTTLNSALDHYDTSSNRLAPMAQVGYWSPINTEWLWGIAAQWQYLGYKTPNVNSSQGQYIPNASFSSINIFGPDVTRDFSSETQVNNEVLLLVYLGEQLKSGYAYFGIGPALFTTSNDIYVWSVHKPIGGGDHLSTSSVSSDNTVWGGAVQVGYNYYINPSSFISVNYTYAKSGTNNYTNLANTALLNGAGSPGPTTLDLNRSISFAVQSIMFSINKVF